MALSLLCGGLGVASAANSTVHVDESTPGAAEVYTKTGVDNLLAEYGKKEAVETNKNNIANLKTTTTDQEQKIATNTANIAHNTATIDKKINTETADLKYATKEALNDKADKSDVYSMTDANTTFATKTELNAKADTTALGEYAKTADVNNALNAKANKTDLDNANGNITALQKKTANLNADGTKLTDMTTVETGALKVTGAISNDLGVTTTLTDINNSMTQTATNTGNIANLKTKTDGQQTAIDDLKKKTTKIDYDAANDTTSINGIKVGDQVDMGGKKLTNVGTINGIDIGDAQVDMKGKNLTGVGTINGTKIGTKESGTYIHQDSSIWGNMKNVDTQVKTNADNIETNKNAITALDTKVGKIDDRTGGITRNPEDTQTTIEGSVKVDNQGNVKDVKGLSAETITTGALTVTGASDLKGDVTLGTPNGTNTVTVNGTANFHEEVKMNNGLNVTKGETNLKKTTVDGDLKVTGTITTDRMVFGVKPTNYTEIDQGKVTSKNSDINGAGQSITSSSTFDAEKNEVGFANNTTGDHSHHKQTADSINGYVTDKAGNKTYTKVTATENSFQVQDKDGKNKNHQVNTKDSSVTEITNGDGKTTKMEQTATDIINTAKDGTIKNEANHIENTATTMKTTVTGQATEEFNGGLDTNVTGTENHTVTGDQNIHVTKNQTNKIDGNQENTIGGSQTTTVTGKVTENYNGGQETNVTGNQVINVSGTQTTTATDIKRNASSGMIDTIDNDYGTNTETKVAGKTTTDVSIKGTGEKGKYIRGANESRDYLIKGTLKNSETKTVDATSTEITDGKGKTSATIQDKTQISGSVTNGTSSAVSNVKADSIDTAVKEGTNTSLISQKKDSITSAVGNGTTSTVIQQGDKDITIASNGGTVGIVGKDIINNATNEITNTAGTKITDKVGNNTRVIDQTSITDTVGTASRKIEDGKITDTAGDSTVTTENGKGTTFSKTGSTAYREGGPTDTNISGNTITTGKVTMDYAEVMKDLGVGGNAKIDGKTTTGSLEVTGTSTLKGDVTMESNATVKKDLTVGGNATIAGDVTARSYKVDGKTYINADGINANNQKITNVADGSISVGSKDAVNGGQLYSVKNDLEGKVNKVGANAAAMANLHPMEFDPSSKWNIAAAIGNYGSETAAALGAFYRPNDDVMVNLSTAFGTGENMVGGGVSVRLGKGGNKLSREETNALKAQVADLTARMDALLSVLNPNMSKDFPDVPENHWAYEAVSRLAGNDIVQGYPDGEFHGERTMTRYEMAEIIYNALSRGAEAEKELVEEFKPELQAMAASEKATAEKAEG